MRLRSKVPRSNEYFTGVPGGDGGGCCLPVGRGTGRVRGGAPCI